MLGERGGDEMRHLSNLLLVYLLCFACFVLSFLGVAIAAAFYTFGSVRSVAFGVLLIFGSNAVGSFVLRKTEAAMRARNSESFWLQPASTNSGTVLMNSVVALWLCMTLLLMLVLVLNDNWSRRTAVALP